MDGVMHNAPSHFGTPKYLIALVSLSLVAIDVKLFLEQFYWPLFMEKKFL